jgi:hypothetical protein
MQESFDRILRLAQKTNSRLIIFDKNTDQHLVVMGIDEFEQLSSHDSHVKVRVQTPVSEPVDTEAAHEQALIEALNKEIAQWREKARQQEVAQNFDHLVSPNVPTVPEVQQPLMPAVIIDEPLPSGVAEVTHADSVHLPATSPSSWHRLGDVMARYKTGDSIAAPTPTEVRYEAAPSAEGEATESLDEDPIFLEEPVE